MSIAFDNSALEKNLCSPCSCTGFIPKVKYEVDLKAETVKLTDAAVFDSGDKLEKIILHVYDKDGKQVPSNISVAGGTVTISLTGLNYVDISITATVTSANGCTANMAQYHIGQYSLTGFLQYTLKTV